MTTGSAYEFIREPIVCTNPRCSKQGMYPLRDLVADLSVTCSYCHHVIDLKDRAGNLKQRAEEFKKIKPLGRR